MSLSRRIELEGSATFGRRAMPASNYPGAIVDGGSVSRSEGLLTLAINQRLLRTTTADFHAFLTYGFTSIFGTTSREAARIAYPNGNVYSYAASSHSRTVGGFLVFGGGFEKAVSSRVALRADFRVLTAYAVLPQGVRASVTAVVHLGGR